MKRVYLKIMMISVMSILCVYAEANSHVSGARTHGIKLEMKSNSKCRVCKIYSKEGYTNVRKGPSTKHTIIDVLYDGDVISVVKTVGQWKYVSYHKDGSSKVKYGYIHVSQLRLVSN